jgi:NAD(P)-dependent dehydrogenase (short-subunit alcohol dehydrogenase family)
MFLKEIPTAAIKNDDTKVDMTKDHRENTVPCNGRLKGQVAVITGGSSGIGFATAQQFVREGAYVFLTGRRQAELDAAAKQLGSNATPIQGDVTKAADLDRLYATVKQEKGHVDTLFANAGVGEFSPLAEISDDHFDKLFNVNVKGLLFTVQKVLPLMVDGGSIILNASRSASKGIPSWSVYSATKAAVRSFARTWTVDLKARRIRVNAISPGGADTPGLRELAAAANAPIRVDEGVMFSTPMGRFGRAEEVATAVCFLASADSSYITGIELFVDGGASQI